MHTTTLRHPMVATTPMPRALPAKVTVLLPLRWLEWLAAWADRQPHHRHLGSWTAV